jgi:hypothetical protein
MTPKAPAMLVVLVEAAGLRWFVAALGPDGRPAPLLRSGDGDLAKYRDLPFDEQVAFLRHRFCGVLQRGCDRLWARELKASHFVIVFEGALPDPTGELVRAIADHFTLWMVNPPAAVFARAGGRGEPARLEKVAGELDPSRVELLAGCLGDVLAARDDPAAWEVAPARGG